MKLATYNINSVNARIPNLLNWLKEAQPDVVLLQEIKCVENDFPWLEIQAAGYDAKVLGQKSYNGVAVLSRLKMKTICEGLPQFDDENARYLEVEIETEHAPIVVASLYLPNGNPPYNAPHDESKFEYKLKWMDAFYARAKDLLKQGKIVLLGGDYNVILTDDDVYNPALFKNNALCREEVRQRFKAIEYLGWYDAYRALHPKDIGYTYWDYSGNALAADWGMRIDYFMLSPKAVDALEACYVDKKPRMADKPSDHTPLVVELKC